MAKQEVRRAPHRARQQAVQMRRLLVLDALRSSAISAVALGVIFLAWVLQNVELLAPEPALTITTITALFIALHAGVRSFIDERTPAWVAIGVGIFAVVWMASLAWPFYQTINAPPPLFAGELQPAAAPVTVPIQGRSGTYRIVVSGHLPPSSDRTTQSLRYRLHVGNGGELDQVLEGDFSEGVRRQRLGRRGGVNVHVAHTVVQHRIDDPSGRDLTIALTELIPSSPTAVTVEVFAMPFSTLVLAAIGIGLTAAALVVDAWRALSSSEGLMTMETLGAVLGLVAFRAFAHARPGFGDLAFNGLLGGIVGVPAGALLWFFAKTPLRRLSGAAAGEARSKRAPR